MKLSYLFSPLILIEQHNLKTRPTQFISNPSLFPQDPTVNNKQESILFPQHPRVTITKHEHDRHLLLSCSPHSPLQSLCSRAAVFTSYETEIKRRSNDREAHLYIVKKYSCMRQRLIEE